MKHTVDLAFKKKKLIGGSLCSVVKNSHVFGISISDILWKFILLFLHLICLFLSLVPSLLSPHHLLDSRKPRVNIIHILRQHVLSTAPCLEYVA